MKEIDIKNKIYEKEKLDSKPLSEKKCIPEDPYQESLDLDNINFGDLIGESYEIPRNLYENSPEIKETPLSDFLRADYSLNLYENFSDDNKEDKKYPILRKTKSFDSPKISSEKKYENFEENKEKSILSKSLPSIMSKKFDFEINCESKFLSNSWQSDSGLKLKRSSAINIPNIKSRSNISGASYFASLKKNIKYNITKIIDVDKAEDTRTFKITPNYSKIEGFTVKGKNSRT